MAEEEQWQQGLEEAAVVPWLSSFAGGFWAGLEPMFLLTFLIATLGALAFMCAMISYQTVWFAQSPIERSTPSLCFVLAC